LHFPIDIDELLRDISSVCSSDLQEIWLIGSRAIGTAREVSDWDFLVFAGNECLNNLYSRTNLNHSNVDLLVVYDNDHFKEPWGEDPKKGSLSEWSWNRQSDSSATYIQVKFIADPDEDPNSQVQEGQFDEKVIQAMRIK
jgi:predicted nucleotidyltransferase